MALEQIVPDPKMAEITKTVLRLNEKILDINLQLMRLLCNPTYTYTGNVGEPKL